jgi:hypothetical protein
VAAAAAVKAPPTPAQLVPIYKAAAARYGVPWTLLAAINKVESDFGRNNGPSSAGALGPMQFEPATWKAYGVDANGDGVANINDPVDAIYSAAHLLSANGADSNVSSAGTQKAIFSYNHSSSYVKEVTQLAGLFGKYDTGSVGGNAIGAVTGGAKSAIGAVTGLPGTISNAVTGAESWLQNEATVGFAYLALTGLALAFIAFGAIKAAGGSPASIAKGAAGGAWIPKAGTDIPF